MPDLEKKVVVVTGACGDLGQAIVSGLASRGARVVASDLHPEDEAPGALRQGETSYQRCDVRRVPEIRALLGDTWSAHGQVDGLVAAAGIVPWLPALEVTPEQWQQVIDVNLTGAFLSAQAAAKTMSDHNWPGAIVMIGSWIGVAPANRLLPYCVSKAGIDMVARCLALECGPLGVRVNVVAPGVVDAGVSAAVFREAPERRRALEEVVPLGSLGTAGQVADAVAFLLSDEAYYVTGETLVVDGGLRLAHAGG